MMRRRLPAAHRLRLVVTAGPTWEPLDPVRVLANRSTGAMGYAIAAEAARRGHSTTLISGPSALAPPRGVRVVRIETAGELRDAVLAAMPRAEGLIMASAVSDYRPLTVAPVKLKRDQEEVVLWLVRNPDILAEVRRRFRRKLLVGFALESEQMVARARAKLAAKHVDLIVANQVTGQGGPFGNRPVAAAFVRRDGVVRRLPPLPKRRLAAALLDEVSGLC